SPPTFTVFPYTTLFRSERGRGEEAEVAVPLRGSAAEVTRVLDRRVDHDASLIDRGLEAEVDAAEQAEGDGDRLSHPGCTAAERRSEEHTSELQSRENLV